VPLHGEAHDALARWYVSRPTSTSDALFVSLRQRWSATAEAISASAVGDVVAKHAAATGVREDRRTAHALRHTFCTMLDERDVAWKSSASSPATSMSARRRSTSTSATKDDGIGQLERIPHPLAG
jgi:integrase